LKLYLIFIAFLFQVVIVSAQQTTIRGKVIDAESGSPIPFANVVIQGTSIGSPTDFEGYYEINGEATSDTLIVSFIGYERKKKVYKKGISQTINFQLSPETTSYGEFVITAGKTENPAFPIMRKVMENKFKNDKRRISAYKYESYNKIEIAVDNLTEKFRQKKYVKKITLVLDSIEQIAGEDGKPILPLFISESLSEFHFRSNPKLQKERIIKTKITGVGIEDGSLVSQVIGSSFQEYNFYQNRMNIVDKEFASPLGDGWRVMYNYELQDSVFLGDDFCYVLDFVPKNDQELAFYGKVWITKEDYAIKQIDATMQPTANLNFIEKIKIQQELEKTTNGAWLPVKSRILIDVSELTKSSVGFLAKFYSSNKNLTITEPKPTKFFEHTIELEEDARVDDEQFWIENRHDSLSSTERNVMAMIDSLNSIPFVKTWVELAKTFVRGYVEVGKLDLGPWPVVVSENDVEGWRLRVGARTNEHFSLRWQFEGYVAYGFEDEKFKYGLGATWIANRKKWTTLSIGYRQDIDQMGIQPDPLNGFQDGLAFVALTRLGDLVRPFQYERYQFDYFRQASKAFSFNITLRNQRVTPKFPFEYFTEPGNIDSPTASNYTTTEATIRLKYARDETFLINDNSRRSLGTLRWPSISAAYTRGFKGPLGGDFNFNRVDFGISQRLKMGFWGVSFYEVRASKMFTDVPYPLLRAHIGNDQIVYTPIAFNQMEFFEYVSDTYASIRYTHFFEGFILNRIPLLKRLKWRLVGSANVLFGGVRQSNLDLQVKEDQDGNPLPLFDVLDNGKPFAEVGIGVENILKIFRVDYFTRLTYLDKPGIRKSSVKISFNISL